MSRLECGRDMTLRVLGCYLNAEGVRSKYDSH